MVNRGCARTLVAAGAAFAITSAAQAVTCPTVGETLPAGIYVASTNGDLWRVSPVEGRGVATAVFVGHIADDKSGFYPTDIAFNDDGSLYGVDGLDLFCMDPTTGSAVTIGGSEFEPPWQTALAGRTFSLGQLYGAGEDRLVEIQIGSGKGTLLPSEFGPLSCGAETGDIVFDAETDTLFGTVECVGGGLRDRSHLVKLDPATGAVVQNLGPITDAQGALRYGVFGLAFGMEGGLYAGVENSLIRIDPASGKGLEEFTIISNTPGERFTRVDGMASRVCENPATDRPGPSRLTAGQWRQECRDGLDPELAALVDPMVDRVTNGEVGTACDALHHVRAAAVVQDGADTQLGSPLLGQVEQVSTAVATVGGRRGTRVGDSVIAKTAHGENDETDGGGNDTLCGLALRELTAAHLNVASGRINAACWHCDIGIVGEYVDQLADAYAIARVANDRDTCNQIKRDAHHVVGNYCPPPGQDEGGDPDDRGRGNDR